MRFHSLYRLCIRLAGVLIVLLAIGQIPVSSSMAAVPDPLGGAAISSEADRLLPSIQPKFQAADPETPSACPAAPASLPDIIERTDFCIYYDSDSTTLAQATTAADHVEDYWDRYVTDFGFLTPSFTDKLEVQLTVNTGCNGGTSSGSNVMDTWTGCYGNPESIQKVLGHELFHRVQYSYDGSEVKWFKEGTARAMEDLAFNNIDNWATTLTAVSSSFNKQVNTYLADTNNDITSIPMRYNSALWWKYFTEQYGSTATEPELGVDAFLALWQAAASADDLAALNNALSSLGAGVNFDTAFRRFVVANWTKDLSGLPDASYNYVDEDQVGNGAPYGPLVPTNGGTINIGTSAVFNNQSVTRYGAAYYEASPGGNCPVVSASFHKDSGADAFYHVITQKAAALATHVEGSGTDWTQSFLNDGITKIVAIIGGQANSAQVDITFSCADPVIDIQLPDNVAEAHVGPFDTPGKFLAQVLVTNGSPTGPVVAGLTNNDFKARVNNLNALITGGGFIQEQYWLVVQAPVQVANGTYDLEIILEEPGTATPIASDTNASSVTYDPDNTDHVLVIDRSGSMSQSNKMVAAKDAANFYVDITRNNDGLSVVPYNHDVNPAPFAMQSVNLIVRNNAKSFVNGLTASGATSIGDGLDEAVNQRAGSPTGNPLCSFVLLSDGMENSDQFWADVQAAVVGSNCPVTTIAFGPQSNETLMQTIATATGGLSFYNDVFVSSTQSPEEVSTALDVALDLGSVYEYAQGRTERRQRLLAEKGTVPFPPVEQVHNVMVDGTVAAVLFAVDWYPNSFPCFVPQLRLMQPDGSIIDESVMPYSFLDFTSGHLGWRIANPDPGNWQMLVTSVQGPGSESAPSGCDVDLFYQALASGRSNLTLDLLLPDRLGMQYFTGNVLPLYAFLSSAGPISNTLVLANVTAPNGMDTLVPLFDDGQHGDGAANDGFYANTYTRVNQADDQPDPSDEPGDPMPNDEGGYRVRVRAMGADFQREALGAFSVLEGDDLNGNGLPDPFEETYGVDNPDADLDLDLLTTLDEYLVGTDPNNSDTDGGGENDGSEILFGLDPLDPGDDQIEAPEFIQSEPKDGAVRLTYDVRAEYTLMRLFRATNPNGPWFLQVAELPLTGVYTDTGTNDTTYYYRLLGMDADGHGSALPQSEGVTPSIDPVLPEARVIIDGGAPSTTGLDVTLSFAPYEGEGPEDNLESFTDITEMMLSNDSAFSGAVWQPFAQDQPWQLEWTFPGTLAKVYARFRDGHGNVSAGTEVGMILYDPYYSLLPLTYR